MRGRLNTLAAAGLLLAVSGCGENKVKLDVARSVSESAATSMGQAAAYFDAIEAQRRAAAAAFVARDPNCLPTRRLTIQRPSLGAKKRTPLCPAGAAADPGYRLQVMDFGTRPEAVLEARAAMISAVADYGRALAKIVADKNADISAELASFSQKVDRVVSLVNLVSRDQMPTLGGQLQTPQAKSLIDLVQFASDLAFEARQVEQVKARVRLDGAKVDAALEALRGEVLIRGLGTAQNASFLSRNALMDAYRDQRFRMSFAERRAAALEIFEAEDAEAGLAENAKRVADALAETQTGQQGLRAVLDNRFTPAQRRKAAAENLDRITRAMKIVASVGFAFS